MIALIGILPLSGCHKSCSMIRSREISNGSAGNHELSCVPLSAD